MQLSVLAALLSLILTSTPVYSSEGPSERTVDYDAAYDLPNNQRAFVELRVILDRTYLIGSDGTDLDVLCRMLMQSDTAKGISSSVYFASNPSARRMLAVTAEGHFEFVTADTYIDDVVCGE